MKEAIAAAANALFPLEACGFVLRGGAVVTCRNEADDPFTGFVIGRDEADDWWATGQVEGVWHSHPQSHAVPSSDDQRLAVPTLDFYIYSVPDEDLAVYRPDPCGRLQLVQLHSPA